MMPEWNVFLLRLCWDIAEPGLRYRKFSALVCVLQSHQSLGWPTFQSWSALFSRTTHRPTDTYHQKRAVTIVPPNQQHHWGVNTGISLLLEIPSLVPDCSVVLERNLSWASRWVGKTKWEQTTELHVGQHQLMPLELDISETRSEIYATQS